MVAEIERRNTGLGMGTQERVIDRRWICRVRWRRLAEHRAPTKDYAQRRDPTLCCLRQCVVSQGSIGEFGVATMQRQLDAVKGGYGGRNTIVGFVGMPAV